MSSIINHLKKKIPVRIQFVWDLFEYYKLLVHYNASTKTDKDINKMQYTLLRENHVIEKGMSMKQPRRGFGQQKVLALIERLSKYNDLYGSQDKFFLLYPLSTIRKYIEYTKTQEVDIPNIENAFNGLVERTGLLTSNLTCQAGVETVYKQQILAESQKDFEHLLYNRHSIRYFTTETPQTAVLDKVLTLAQRTPSACNRQAWHTHVYFGTQCHELLKAQGGCNGFEVEIPCCIVVTADMKGFLSYEPFQCYVDGGLYAMNLINAVHHYGMGAIPLSCGFHFDKLNSIQRKFQIPSSERMIVIVGIGYLEDNFKIAISTRQPIEKTNTYHTEK